jgi:uncharacterized membrane protein
MTDAAVFAALATGQERTFHQDLLFAFRLLVGIGLRALSLAINDPAIAVQVLDTVESLLQVRPASPHRGAHAGNFPALWQNVASARDEPAR